MQVVRGQPPSDFENRLDFLLAYREHYAESSAAAEHLLERFIDLFKRVFLDHGADAGQRTEIQRVLPID